MSVVAAAAGGSGDGNGGDGNKNKGKLEFSDSSSESETSSVEVTDEELDLEPVDLSNYEAERLQSFLRLSSIEKYLPRKRSISSHYQGKSKSFGNLAELGTEEAKDLEKQEHPLNKKRRLQIAQEIRNKELSGEASSNVPHASSLPHLPKNEDDGDKESDHDVEMKAASDDDDGK